MGLFSACLPAVESADSTEAAEPAEKAPVFQPEDHVAILGNTLAERFQHDGWLETLLVSRLPEHRLSVRNLGFSGDELTLRLRSEGFGSPDDHLKAHQTDVVLAFFGFNESFGGEAGLEKFKADLAEFIRHTFSQKYNGQNAPRLVLFSPIAQENLHDVNLAGGGENNSRIELYTRAMSEVARAEGVLFVDLFHPTQGLCAKADKPLTINGIHLSAEGNRQLAQIIQRELLGPVGQASSPTPDPARLEKLRAAVLDKDFHWFERYRTVDGYSIYGGRAGLGFVDNQTNRVVMQREMEILDVMTANRDRRIWAIAQGSDLAIDDSNTPPPLDVKTNIPGPLPDGKHEFLDGEEAISKMQVAPGLKVNLFASEKEFPEIANPVQMTFDTRGRLWVATMPSYPHWKPKDKLADKIVILEDTSGNGRADKLTVFADDLHLPTGLEFCKGGILVGQMPDLVLLKDTDGDDRADQRERVLHGFDSADTHHAMNSFVLDPGGALYFQEGVFHHSQTETRSGVQRSANGAVFRYEPRTEKFEVFSPYTFINPHGHVFDRWGQDFITDATNNEHYFAAAISGHLDFPHKHTGLKTYFRQKMRPCAGTEILSSRHFPPEYQGNLLVCNVIGFQGIMEHKYSDDGSGFVADDVRPLVASTDPKFRPVDVEVGPDGAIYFLDWQNPIIGHMQHHLRDPSRDTTHGRVYRITCENRPLLSPSKIAGQPIEHLLDLLKEPEDRVRYRARIELADRSSDQVLSAEQKWLAGLDKSDPDYEHHRLEALWLYQSHNAVNRELLESLLRSPEPRARAAATRVLCYQRDRLPNVLALLAQQAADENPRVRLEAVRAASFFTVPEAIEIPLIAADYPQDYYLQYTQAETMRVLEPLWQQAVSEGQKVVMTSEAGTRYRLRQLSIEQLLAEPRDRAVCLELLFRKGLRDEDRRSALADLARLESKPELSVLVGILDDRRPAAMGRDENALADLVRLMAGHTAEQVQAVRGALETVALHAPRPVIRQLGYVALMLAEGQVGSAWELSQSSVDSLLDLLAAVPLVPDVTLQTALYSKIEPFLTELPRSLASNQTTGAEATGRVRRAAMKALTVVRGQEARTFRALARYLREPVDETDRRAAIEALCRLPVVDWPAEEAAPLVASLIELVKSIPASERTSPAALDALQLADNLASLLPLDQAKIVRQQLGALGVRVVRVATQPHMMLYDKEQIVVQAGKPVEILFENLDNMPHNFVIVATGTLEEVGLLAEATAQQTDAIFRQYVPHSDKILLASQLLLPGNSQKLPFTAPAKPGVYPYVCTYPGHWRRMYGSLYVVADLDEYLANPTAYMADHPLEIADPLLQSNRPRTQWKLDDLAAAVEGLDHGHSFVNGKQIFQIANCVACHKLGGVGTDVGPDLAKLDPKRTPVEILRDVLEPSFKINEKYQTFVFETDAGKVVTGLVLEETLEHFKVIENPLGKSEPLILKKSEVEGREPSTTSLMPNGLLDKLTREEILDLLAYVVAGGDEQSPLFRGGHEHHHHH